MIQYYVPLIVQRPSDFMIFLRNGLSSSTLRLFYKTTNNRIVEYHKKANINDKYRNGGEALLVSRLWKVSDENAGVKSGTDTNLTRRSLSL